MRHVWVLGAVLAAGVLVLAGCPVLATGVTVTGTLSAEYFDITSDVTVTITQGNESVSIGVPVVSGNYTQTGAFLVANVPTGTYAAEVTFENSYGYAAGTQYRLNGGQWLPVDNEVVTGDAAPYTFTITIDSLPISEDTTFDVYFGNVG